MQNCFYQIKSNIKFQYNIDRKDFIDCFSKVINSLMQNDKKLKELHSSYQIKGFVFCEPIPFETDNVYKKERIYTILFNFIDMDTALRFKSVLENNDIFSEVVLNSYKFKQINEIKTVSLTVANIRKNTDRYAWQRNNPINALIESLNRNMETKINQFLDLNINGIDFIQSIEVLSKKEIFYNYKRGKLYGNRYKIIVKKDKMSQIAANMAIATGLGSRNSLGCGFCVDR